MTNPVECCRRHYFSDGIRLSAQHAKPSGGDDKYLTVHLLISQISNEQLTHISQIYTKQLVRTKLLEHLGQVNKLERNNFLFRRGNSFRNGSDVFRATSHRKRSSTNALKNHTYSFCAIMNYSIRQELMILQLQFSYTDRQLAMRMSLSVSQLAEELIIPQIRFPRLLGKRIIVYE